MLIVSTSLERLGSQRLKRVSFSLYVFLLFEFVITYVLLNVFPAKFMSIESVMPSNHFILCRPLLLLHSIFPSIRVFSNESALHLRWPKYWSFSFSISPSNEHRGVISFRMDWLDLLAVQLLKMITIHTANKQKGAFSASSLAPYVIIFHVY